MYIRIELSRVHRLVDISKVMKRQSHYKCSGSVFRYESLETGKGLSGNNIKVVLRVRDESGTSRWVILEGTIS